MFGCCYFKSFREYIPARISLLSHCMGIYYTNTQTQTQMHTHTRTHEIYVQDLAGSCSVAPTGLRHTHTHTPKHTERFAHEHLYVISSFHVTAHSLYGTIPHIHTIIYIHTHSCEISTLHVPAHSLYVTIPYMHTITHARAHTFTCD